MGNEDEPTPSKATESGPMKGRLNPDALMTIDYDDFMAHLNDPKTQARLERVRRMHRQRQQGQSSEG